MANMHLYPQDSIYQYMLQQYLQNDQLIIKLKLIQKVQNEQPILNSNELSKQIIENEQQYNKYKVRRLYQVKLKHESLPLDLKQIFLSLDQIREFLDQENQPNQRALISEKGPMGVAEVKLKIQMKVFNRTVYRYFPLVLTQHEIPQCEQFVTRKPKINQAFQIVKKEQEPKPVSVDFVKNVGNVHHIAVKQQQLSQKQLQQQQYISGYFGDSYNQQQQNPAAKKSSFIAINHATPISSQYRLNHANSLFPLKHNKQEEHSGKYKQFPPALVKKQSIMHQKQDRATHNFNLGTGHRPIPLFNQKGFRPYIEQKEIANSVSAINNNPKSFLVKLQEGQVNVQPLNNHRVIDNSDQPLVKIQQQGIRITYIFSQTFKNPQIMITNKNMAGCYNNNKSCKTILIQPLSFHNIPCLSNMESFQLNIRINNLKGYVGIGMCEKETIIRHEYKQAVSQESRLSNQHGYYIVDWSGNAFVNCQTHPNIKSFKFKATDVIRIEYKIAEKVVKFTKLTSRSYQSTELKLDPNARLEELCFCALLSSQGDQVMILPEI